MSDSDSSEVDIDPALHGPTPVSTSRSLYHRHYRRRRQQNPREMPDSPFNRGNISAHDSQGTISDEVADTSDEADMSDDTQQEAGQAVVGDLIQPDVESIVNDEPPDVFNEENDAPLPEEEMEADSVNVNSEHEYYVDVSSSEESEDNVFGSSEDSSDIDSDGSGDGGDEGDQLYPGAPLTVGEALLVILTFFLRHKLSGQCLSDLLSAIALLLPPNNRFTETLYKFKKHFSMLGQSLVVFHYFCSNCEASLNNVDDICNDCDENKVSYFLELPLLKQLQGLFLRPGFFEALQYRFERNKKFENKVEDLYDGAIYKQQVENGFLSNPNSLSFMWYSDGISIYKSTNFSIWPMFLVINELNYKARTNRENVILAGIWFGKSKPNPNLFLSPLHSDLQQFEHEGDMFQRAGGPAIHVRGKLLMCVCDLQAKCRFMRFKQWNGFYGCTSCMIRGQRYDVGNGGGVHVYPYSPVINQRDNDDVPHFARQAVEANLHGAGDVDVYGVKGPTLLFNMLPN